MLNKLIKDSKQIPQTLLYALNNNLLPTLENQKEALTKSKWSYLFARANIPGSNIKALQTKACEDPYYAYKFALDIPGADIQYCQEHACKKPRFAYKFAKDIPGADIKYCQKHACKHNYTCHPNYTAHQFALHIPNSDKEYCFKHAFPEILYGPDRWKFEFNIYYSKYLCR